MIAGVHLTLHLAFWYPMSNKRSSIPKQTCVKGLQNKKWSNHTNNDKDYNNCKIEFIEKPLLPLKVFMVESSFVQIL